MADAVGVTAEEALPVRLLDTDGSAVVAVGDTLAVTDGLLDWLGDRDGLTDTLTVSLSCVEGEPDTDANTLLVPLNVGVTEGVTGDEETVRVATMLLLILLPMSIFVDETLGVAAAETLMLPVVDALTPRVKVTVIELVLVADGLV